MNIDQGKIFIGGISWETNENTLIDHFKKYGEVIESVIMRDRNTGNARGFGFVLFSDSSVADKALQDKHAILGRTVEVKKAVRRSEQYQSQIQQYHYNQQQIKSLSWNSSNGGGSNNQFKTKKIFVGGLSANLTEEEFKSYFEKFGNITDVVVMYDSATHRPRGFGFITFESEEAVENVMLKTFHELNNKLVEVKRAVPKEGINGSSNNKNTNNGRNNYNYNTRVGGRRSSHFSSYQCGYPPYSPSPNYGFCTGYMPTFVPGYGSAGSYPYGATTYGGGCAFGAYNGVSYGLPTGNSWNTMGISRGSLVPYGNGALYPCYVGASGVMDAATGGYHDIMGSVANGNHNQGGEDGDVQMCADAVTVANGGNFNSDSSGFMGSYSAVDSQNQSGLHEQFKSLAVGNSG